MSSEQSNTCPPAHFVPPAESTLELFERVLACLGFDVEGAETAIRRGLAVRGEQLQELDERSYATGFMDALSLAAYLRSRS